MTQDGSNNQQNHLEFVEVIPVVRKYDWGKRENTALTKIYSKNLGLLNEDNDEPYAELWYGSHVSNPSTVKYTSNTCKTDTNKMNTSVTLDDIIINKFKGVYKKKLPFLLKILSISKPLSLQVHPDVNLAKELNLRYPEIYPDDNHKPEIAIALTEFEAFCGFQTTPSIISNIKEYPEIHDLFGYDGVDNSEPVEDPNFEIRKELFVNTFLFQQNNGCCPPSSDLNKQEQLLTKLIDRLKNTKYEERTISENLILRLNEHYPLDIGILSPLLLNYYKLKPGDAIFIGPGTIHSYISGECIECMANSDNVIRCGLTPKHKDVNTLIKAVNFQKNCCKIIYNTNDSLVPSSPSNHIHDYGIKCVDEYHIKTIDIDEYYINNCKDGNGDVLELNTHSYSPTLLITISLGGSNNCNDSNDNGSYQHRDYHVYLNNKKIDLFPGKSLLIDSEVNIKFPKPLEDKQNKHIVALVSIPN
ncbi:mannose-phosphate isomerase [Cryptosporidium bovis]|uniref:mannose-phosphate isomerase n=1 Tax=Cryptosporidium bovis TaxID=310047 RepID=UPI00351A2F92|nr:mannose-phosphate isomerase [Cryptosporidium bovis]